MKLTTEEMATLEKICEGLPRDQIKNVACLYYKEKIKKHSKANKSFSPKKENQLSQCKDIRELVNGVGNASSSARNSIKQILGSIK